VTIERLSPNDRLMLLAGDVWPQEIGALLILDGHGLSSDTGRLRIGVLVDRIESRLHLVPRFRQVMRRPGRMLGGPYWADARRFDIEDHVRIAEVTAPGGTDELLACVEALRRRRLDPRRPAWEMWFLTGLPDGRVGLFVKVHHAMADGMAAMTLIGSFFDGSTDAAGEAPPWRPARSPRQSDLVADAIRARLHSLAGTVTALLHPLAMWTRLHATLPAMRELLADEPPPWTSLDGVVGQDRSLAAMRSSLRELRVIAHAHDATANDVLLTLTAGGLRSLLIGRGEALADVWVPIYVPITMRRRWHGPVTGNRVAQMSVPLPLGIADPVERLARIAASTAERKSRDRSAVGKMFRSSLATQLLLMAIDRQRVNVCSANIPGPRTPACLLGSRVLEVVPILPLISRVSLGVGAVSYAGAFTIGVTADRDAFPDLDALVAGMEHELAELRNDSPSRPSMALSRLSSAGAGQAA
jgi:WS/DGAT/MGAT family acyltransferase